MGTLYVVATPIGNAAEISKRALDILSRVPLIACEDTRTARRLLTANSLAGPPLVSYTEHNRDQRIPSLLAALQVGDLAVISEAGMPGISDPGCELVAAAVDAGHRIVPVSGPSAVLSALAASGLPARRFLFLGFLPRKAGERRAALGEVASLAAALVIFESPRRVRRTVEDLLAVLGDRRMVAAREISKTYEEFIRGRASEVLTRLDNPLGEFTLVVEGAERSAEIESEPLEEMAGVLLAGGMSVKDVATRLKEEMRVPRRRAYEIARTVADQSSL